MAIKLVMWPSGKLLKFPDTHVNAGKLKAYNQDGTERPPKECCCVCDFCPCCKRCPTTSTDVDVWIPDVVQDPDFTGVCVCTNFGTAETLAGFQVNECSAETIPPLAWDCANLLRWEIEGSGSNCIMRVTITGDSTHSDPENPGGNWTAIWELGFTGPVECNDLWELPFKEALPPENVPCIFDGTTAFANVFFPL